MAAKRRLGPHEKTILTIFGAVGFIATLIAFPTLALCAWVAMWVAIGLGFVVCIYGAIYSAFDNGVVHKPKPDEAALLAAFDPVI